MSTSPGLRFLRPYLCKDLAVSRKHAYLRFFSTTRCLKKKKVEAFGHKILKGDDQLKRNTNDRITKLEKSNALSWPRIQNDVKSLTLLEYNEKYRLLEQGDRVKDDTVLLRGRLMAFRTAGSGLIFLDIFQDGYMVQGICNQDKIDAFGWITKKLFKDFCHKLQRGDFISMYGHPHVTKQSKGELSLDCMELPIVLSPSISLIPRVLEDPESRIRNRHVDMLVNARTSDTIRIRSHIIQYIRNFLIEDQFMEVQTPIVAESASGAIARPFTTVATEFSEKQLALRVAPEIWLKRLVIGGIDRVFEIGPAFRNEGLDTTHNPEFTTCEFYKSFANLEDLMTMTDKMVSGVAALVTAQRMHPLKSLPEPDPSLCTTPFKRLEFIPAIEKALGEKLPSLTGDNATEQLIALCKKHNIKLADSLTLPRILDKLAGIYIEPQCEAPTYIIHHPACMGPLAKSFVDPNTRQVVSARAELFIQKREIANMYEEENSPLEQRYKFTQQAKFKDEENKASIDESYLEALEWGLPPTGGWGCGIDRLVMLFSGASRISDVLAFGSLRNVVNLGNPAPRASAVVKKLEALAVGEKEQKPVSKKKKAAAEKKHKKKKAAAEKKAEAAASQDVTPLPQIAETSQEIVSEAETTPSQTESTVSPDSAVEALPAKEAQEAPPPQKMSGAM